MGNRPIEIGDDEIQVNRRPMPLEISRDFRGPQLRRDRTIPEKKDRHVRPLELDPARAEPPLQRKVERLAIERDGALQIANLDIRVGGQHSSELSTARTVRFREGHQLVTVYREASGS